MFFLFIIMFGFKWEEGGDMIKIKPWLCLSFYPKTKQAKARYFQFLNISFIYFPYKNCTSGDITITTPPPSKLRREAPENFLIRKSLIKKFFYNYPPPPSFLAKIGEWGVVIVISPDFVKGSSSWVFERRLLVFFLHQNF